MKRRFKFIAILLAALCMLSVFTVTAEEQNAAEQGYDYSKEMGLLSKLGIVDSRYTDFSANVSRGELVEAVMKLAGYENVGLGLVPPFSDVKESDSFYGAVSSAHSLGYIDGSGNFLPSEKVSFYEAADMLTAILGYVYVWDRYEAKNPVLAAHRIGVADGISLSATDSVTKGDMITMLHNALFINVMKPTVYYYSDNFDLGSGDMLLTEVFDIYKSTGLVETTPLTSLYDDEGCAYNHIVIGGATYRTNDNFWDFIGHNVTYYYHSFEGENTVIYMHDRYSDVVFTVDFDDVENFTETKLSYLSGNTEKTKSIVKYATFLYNGKLKSFSSINKNIQSGRVTLIDSDGDGKYDVVNVTEQVHGRVTSFSKSNFNIFTAQNQTFDLRAETAIREVEIVLDGNLVSFDSLALNDIVSVEETTGEGMNRIRVYISRNSVEGTIVALNEDTVKIEDTEYKFDTTHFTPNVGDYGKFYIAANGKIVITELENYVVYGFLYKVIHKNSLYPVRAKIFSDKGRWVELDVADKITYNGDRKEAEYLLIAPELLSEGDTKPQLVAYRVNSEKKLVSLNTAKPVTRWSQEEKQAIENADFRYVDLGKKSIAYRNSLKCFNLEAYLTAESYVFVIPGEEGDKTFDTSEAYLATSSNFTNDVTYNNLNFYDMDEWGNIGAMVIYGGLQTNDVLNRQTNISPVVGTGEGIDSKGNICKTVSVMMSGNKITLPVDSSVNFDAFGLKKGDVIRYTTTNNGSIALLSLDYRPDDVNYENVLLNGIYGTRTLASGKVDKIDVSANKILITKGENKYIMDLSATKETYIFNANKTGVRKGTVSDVPIGADVFMYAVYGKIQQIIVYE